MKSLPDEHLTELRELVKDYSYTVQEQEKDYWPDLEEYPALLVLFEYEIEFGEDRYATDGALCYPDGWDEFVNQLLEYGSAQNGGETDEEDTGAFLSGTSYFNGYSIYLECPEPGHPSGGSMWSTDYVDEEKDIDVSVDIYALEGSLEEKKQELESSFEELEEGNLWGHECSY